MTKIISLITLYLAFSFNAQALSPEVYKTCPQINTIELVEKIITEASDDSFASGWGALLGFYERVPGAKAVIDQSFQASEISMAVKAESCDAYGVAKEEYLKTVMLAATEAFNNMENAEAILTEALRSAIDPEAIASVSE